MKHIKLALTAAVIAFGVSNAHAQTYKTDFSTGIVLAGGGNSTVHTVTLNAAAPSSGTVTLTFPNAYPGADAATYLLTSTTGGAMSWVDALTLNGLTSINGLTSGGAATNLNNADNDAVNIGNGATGANLIGIGNGDGVTAPFTTTTFGGLVNFTGKVSIPAGSLDLGLNQNNLYVGNASNIAAPLAPSTNSVFITDATNLGTPQWSSTLPSAVQGNITTVGTLTSGAIGAGFTAIPNSALANSTIGLSSSGSVSIGTTTIDLGSGSSLDLNMGYTNDWTIKQEFDNGIASTNGNDLSLSSSGNSIDLNTGNSDGVNIGTDANSTNAIDIGNGIAPLTGSYSTTTLAGLVNFTGAVTLPAGSIAPSSLPLANNDIYVGVGGDADSARIIQDITLSGATSYTVTATVNSSNATTFGVVHAETVGGTLGVTGQTTLGSTGLSNGSVAAIPALVLDGNHSYYSLTGAAPVAIASITATPAYAQGQILVLVNAGTANFTLTQAGLGLNGGDVIMGPGGTATIMYDGTSWHLMGAE